VRVGVPTLGRVARLQAAGCLAAAGSVLALTRFDDPRVPGHYPPCPFHALTGLDCPGCGTLRAMHALMTGDVASAIGYNLLFVCAIPLFLFVGVRLARNVLGRPTPPLQLVVLARVAVPVIVLFWVLRNTSPFHFLAA